VCHFALGGVLAAALALAVPASGQASPYGIQYFGTRSIDGYTIPGGQLAHYISGSGLFIAWDGSNVGSIGNLCDACARLYVDDWRHYVTQQCHFVY
jgi:hypothetical protein